MKIYIASALSNSDNVKAFRDRLSSLGHTITYDWTAHNFVDDVNKLQEIAYKELNGVLDADLLIVLYPWGFGTHCELGIAAAVAKPIYMYIPDDAQYQMKSFYYLKNVSRFNDLDKLVATI